MARYVAERLERQAHDLDGAKDAVKHLADPERAHLVKWIVRYYDDDGKLLSPYRKDIPLRRTIVIDGEEYWLVRRPGKPTSETRERR